MAMRYDVSISTTKGISGMAWHSLFEAWMPSSVPQMVLLTFAKTKVRLAVG